MHLHVCVCTFLFSFWCNSLVSGIEISVSLHMHYCTVLFATKFILLKNFECFKPQFRTDPHTSYKSKNPKCLNFYVFMNFNVWHTGSTYSGAVVSLMMRYYFQWVVNIWPINNKVISGRFPWIYRWFISFQSIAKWIISTIYELKYLKLSFLFANGKLCGQYGTESMYFIFVLHSFCTYWHNLAHLLFH